ncbi:LysR family transcriptional regulator (chromosome initiation inhibitor) [Acinetobacter baylyi]|uniref:LysR family transcriptional regulator (Chromosome initiation inhibitor) n=1 Tax=Acinetobacter baylyi TaxID=202950 RepID=A0ABU0UVH2_ACIBI|nr:ArgP/LysG family DNA-binding transcriptional regulator [Acinetobacter baylyi]MDQ1208283.1 LysR family transcriptional regulator (chromosome initiation inhibitor) [Acinetobacter baylyi]MDR6108127.1 LysR family transcriptional regulator (chromosome initiation inhibitor) [Acinetobacter baylyi]
MLDNKQCDAFFAVAEQGSFEQAAIQLCISASAVTLRVQALEKDLGQLLLIRARPCTLTHAGQKLFEHLQHTRRLEQNFLHNLTDATPSQFFKVVMAANADSLATWLLPALNEVASQQKLMLEILLDDQSHTHALMEKGTVSACISIEPKAMKGCKSVYLGSMRYKMLATQAFQGTWFRHGVHREALRVAPAIIFNHKDQMHFDLLEKQYGLIKGAYPCHYIPSSACFFTAVQLGLGYGLVPELQLKQAADPDQLRDIMPEMQLDIPLYWHHWQQQSRPLQSLTEHLTQHAAKYLSPL